MIATPSLAQRSIDALTDAIFESAARRGVLQALLAGTTAPALPYEELARELGDVPLKNGETFFGLLAENGEVGALELQNRLGLDRTPDIAFVLTTPLKRISTRLGMAWPFDVDTGADGRTVWRDRDGLAGQMLDAVRAEKKRRGL